MTNQPASSDAEADELIERTRKGAYQEPASCPSSIRQVSPCPSRMHADSIYGPGPGTANISQCRATPCSGSFWNNQESLLPLAEKRSACFRRGRPRPPSCFACRAQRRGVPVSEHDWQSRGGNPSRPDPGARICTNGEWQGDGLNIGRCIQGGWRLVCCSRGGREIAAWVQDRNHAQGGGGERDDTGPRVTWLTGIVLRDWQWPRGEACVS